MRFSELFKVAGGSFAVAVVDLGDPRDAGLGYIQLLGDLPGAPALVEEVTDALIGWVAANNVQPVGQGIDERGVRREPVVHQCDQFSVIHETTVAASTHFVNSIRHSAFQNTERHRLANVLACDLDRR